MAAGLLAGACLGAGVPATAQAPASATPAPAVAGQSRQITELQAGQLLMNAGKVAEAKIVLLDLEKRQPADNEVQFLLGLLAVQDKDYDGAVRHFRAILSRDPKAVRVRLELGRVFFLKKDWDNAERQFRFARAGDLPATARANVDQYLYAIRESRRWSFNFALALAPDTNLNAGPGVTTVDIYGLPFQLSPDARRQSGVGVSVDAGGEWSAPLSERTRLRLGAQIHRTDYPGSEFDDMTLAVYAGPRFIQRRWEISPLLTGFRRWYGNGFYNEGIGGSLQGIFYPSRRLGLSAVVGGQAVTYALKDQSGPSVTGALSFFYTLTPDSVLSGSLSVARQEARVAAYASTTRQIQIGLSRDLPHGYTASVQPSYAWIGYDAALAAFGVPRRDRQLSAQVTVLNRRIDVFGFTPRLSYTYTHNASDIALYGYVRSRAEVGLTRVF